MSAKPALYPLMFRPVYKDYIWGGDRIARRYGRSLSPGTYAESWELTDRAEGVNVVVNGVLAGKDLHELTQMYGVELLGREMERFPLLIKLIDAKERLSVQVHPNDQTAALVGAEPKTEMWFMLDAEPDARVYAGFKDGVDEQQFRAAIVQGRVGDILQAVPVVAGDAVYIPGGCVHTIGEGCLILEVQQNSDTTYRVFDWNRVGANGKPRELHLKQAMQAIDWRQTGTINHPPPSANTKTNTIVERIVSPYFRVEQMFLFGILVCALDRGSFHALFLEDGFVRIKAGSVLVDVNPGTTILLPAGLKEYEIANLNTGGASRLLRVSLP